jgi:hypothetical protein
MFDKIFIIGAGGTGTHLIPPFARFLKFKKETRYSQIFIIDGDKFEEENMKRQLMSLSDVGKNKATATVDRCKELGIFTQDDDTISSIEEYASPENLIPWFEDSQCPLVIAAVDNNASRRAIIDALTKVCIDDQQKDFFFITPGNSDVTAGAPRGQACWWGFINGQAYGQNPIEYDLDLQNPTDEIPRMGSCLNHMDSHPQVITANLTAASKVFEVVQSLIDKNLDPNKSQIAFNCNTLMSSVS